MSLGSSAKSSVTSWTTFAKPNSQNPSSGNSVASDRCQMATDRGMKVAYVTVNGGMVGGRASASIFSFQPSIQPCCNNCLHCTEIWRERTFILLCRNGFDFFKARDVVCPLIWCASAMCLGNTLNGNRLGFPLLSS